MDLSVVNTDVTYDWPTSRLRGMLSTLKPRGESCGPASEPGLRAHGVAGPFRHRYHAQALPARPGSRSPSPATASPWPAPLARSSGRSPRLRNTAAGTAACPCCPAASAFPRCGRLRVVLVDACQFPGVHEWGIACGDDRPLADPAWGAPNAPEPSTTMVRAGVRLAGSGTLRKMTMQRRSSSNSAAANSQSTAGAMIESPITLGRAGRPRRDCANGMVRVQDSQCMCLYAPAAVYGLCMLMCVPLDWSNWHASRNHGHHPSLASGWHGIVACASHHP